MRLIDADKLEYFRCEDNKCDSAYDVKCQTCEYAVIHKHNIDNAPTIEPKKGKWIRGEVAFYDTCPFCNTNVRKYKCEIFLDEGEMNFCPNCGADMREADND